MSRADWNLREGSFSRQCRIILNTPVDHASAPESGGGSSLRTALNISAALSPANARLPETTSHRTGTTLNRSVR